MGVKTLRLVAPPGLEPDPSHYPDAVISNDIDAAAEGADVLMALRIQRERMESESGLMSHEEYLKRFGITAERVELAQPGVIVMHPGPMNRDVEISGAVADGPHSVITKQVSNGLAVRMAILATISSARPDP
jgi:aspartate carbamoyltransferase catalytic subunit